MSRFRPPLPLLYEPVVEAALREDLGRAGDQTTDAVVPADATATARLVARRAGRIAGLEVACRAFTLLDPRVQVELRAADGDDAAADTTLAVRLGPVACEARNMIDAARLIARAALVRTESRGAHFRSDYPAPDPAWVGGPVS